MILWTITIILVVGLMDFAITVASRHVAGLNGPWKKLMLTYITILIVLILILWLISKNLALILFGIFVVFHVYMFAKSLFKQAK